MIYDIIHKYYLFYSWHPCLLFNLNYYGSILFIAAIQYPFNLLIVYLDILYIVFYLQTSNHYNVQNADAHSSYQCHPFCKAKSTPYN